MNSSLQDTVGTNGSKSKAGTKVSKSKKESAVRIKNIVEAVLLTVGKPLDIDRLLDIFGDDEQPTKQLLREVLDGISADCETKGFELVKVASGYRFQIKQDFAPWVSRLWEERPQRYSRALLETLALIAYRQPITRGDIEDIRGVAVSSNIIKTLVERSWIRVVGHKDVPGKPAMYGTTKQFLDYFNLQGLDQLPPLSEIRDIEAISLEMKRQVTPENGKAEEMGVANSSMTDHFELEPGSDISND
ncbi:SMC-Scp complex subunit ScpB [Alkalimarinus coralli]|uniref:SMC-Scp complex subunit ScpB n=1 Tax=Alkalimarinus coralli TaxID=2935863 RepID=UPI00202B345D|nr:SMC-Scp complex subunit ScpB [Alkalimarinus coralli]